MKCCSDQNCLYIRILDTNFTCDNNSKTPQADAISKLLWSCQTEHLFDMLGSRQILVAIGGKEL